MDRFEKLKCKQLRGSGNLSYSIFLFGHKGKSQFFRLFGKEKYNTHRDLSKTLTHITTTTNKRKKWSTQRESSSLMIVSFVYTFTRKEMGRKGVTKEEEILISHLHLSSRRLSAQCCFSINHFPTWTRQMFIQPKMDWKIECREYDTAFWISSPAQDETNKNEIQSRISAIEVLKVLHQSKYWFKSPSFPYLSLASR